MVRRVDQAVGLAFGPATRGRLRLQGDPPAVGITTEYSPLRHANNLESVLTYEGTSEVHQLALGQALTGISAYR